MYWLVRPCSRYRSFRPSGRPDVTGIAMYGVGQVGLGPGGVAQLVQTQLGRQVEQLGRLVAVFDRLGPSLVERDQLVVFFGLAIGLPKRDERLRVGGVALQRCLVFACGRHTLFRLYDGPSPHGSGRRTGRTR